MKTIEEQTKRAAWILFGIGFACVAFSLLSGCGSTELQGPPGQQGAPGEQGPTGEQGATGQTGTPGQSCTVKTVAPSHAAPNGGSLIACPDGSQSLVLNGTNCSEKDKDKDR